MLTQLLKGVKSADQNMFNALVSGEVACELCWVNSSNNRIRNELACAKGELKAYSINL